jgi:hypothetical protein
MNNKKIDSPANIYIESVTSQIESVKIRIVGNGGRGLVVVISNDSFDFYATENDAGTVYGVPVRKTAQDIIEWVEGETPIGGRKRLGDRKGLKQIGRRAPVR